MNRVSLLESPRNRTRSAKSRDQRHLLRRRSLGIELLEDRRVLSVVFSEGFEAGWGDWTASADVWQVGTPTSGPSSAYGGSSVAGTVLSGSYAANTSSRLISPALDLPMVGDGERLELRFQQWYAYASGDYGEVQISVGSESQWSEWETLARPAPTGSSAGWSLAAVDLTSQAGQRVRIGFMHQANFATESSGWYVDEVDLWQGVPDVTWPQGFEDGWGGWSASAGVWQVGVPASGPGSAHTGNSVAGTVLSGIYPANTASRLVSPVIDLPAVTDGQRLELRFQQWYAYASGDYGEVQISVGAEDQWSEWETLARPAPTGSSAGWSLAAVDLTAQAGQRVRIGFMHQANFATESSGWYVDEVDLWQGVPDVTWPQGFEGGWDGWSASAGVWQVGAPASGPGSAYAGSSVAGTVLSGNYPASTTSRLVSPVFDLPAVTDGQRLELRFQQWYAYASGDYGEVQISVWAEDQWSAWQTLSLPAATGSSPGWSLAAVDLTAEAGQRVRIGFTHQADFAGQSSGWYVDEVDLWQGVPDVTWPQGFEGGWDGWSASAGVWQVGAPASGPGSAYAGSSVAGTVLSGNYPASTTSRLVSPVIDLPAVTDGQRLELRFQQWYAYASGDYGEIQVSVWADGQWSAWQTLSRPAPTGSSPGWSLAAVDLTAQAGQRVRIGFAHQADFASQNWGWYVDEVDLWQGVPDVTWPQGFEDGWGGWSASAGVWQVGVPASGPGSAHAGSSVAGTVLSGNYPANTASRLVSPVIDLPAVTEGQRLELRFQQWYAYASGDYGEIQVSVWADGQWSAWQTLSRPAPTGSSPGWSLAAVDLTAQAGQRVRIGFTHQADFASQSSGWYVDEVDLWQGVPHVTWPQGFEDGWGGWSASAGVWQVGVPASGPSGAPAGSSVAGTVLDGNYPANTASRLVSPAMELPAIAEEQCLELRFQQWYAYASGDYGEVQILVWVDGVWSAWETLARPAPTGSSGSSDSWLLAKVDLTAKAGAQVRIGFTHQADFAGQSSGWYVDEVEVVVVEPPAPSVLEFFPGPGRAASAMRSLWVSFTTKLDPATVNLDNVSIVAPGPDGQFGTADDAAIGPLVLDYDAELSRLDIEYAAGFAQGRYQLHLSDDIRGTLGLALDGEGDYVSPSPDPLPSGDTIPGGSFVAEFLIDTSSPAPMLGLRSTTHVLDEPSTIDQIGVRWNAAEDAVSGLAGYVTGWDRSADTPAAELQTLLPVSQGTKSPPLGDAADYWFHIAAVDRAGNLSPAMHLGPFSIETGGPRIASVSPSDGSVDATPPSEIRVVFRDADLDPVTVHALSFVVQASGGDRTFDDGNEVPIAGTVAYDPATRTATFTPAGPLEMDAYRITVRDTVSDIHGHPLDGNADGINGDDFVSFFYLDASRHVSGTIAADTTWRGLIVVDSTVTVASGATLTIDPGTVVKFKKSARLDVKGTLEAVGPYAQPIVFTSFQDDAVAGDTNGDGSASNPAANDWPGIRFSSATAVGRLENVRITYADRAIEGSGSGASIQIRNGVLRGNRQGIYTWTSLVDILAENCLIADNRLAGIFARADSRIVIRNSTIVGNGFQGGGYDRNAIHVGAANLTLENSIVAFNANGLHHSGDIPQVAVRHNVFFNPAGQEILWTSNPGEPKLNENGNHRGDPLFVNRAAGDYSLAAGSPAIDAGRGRDAPARDLLGQPRYDDPGMANVGSGAPAFVDIGVFERQFATPLADLAVLAVAAPRPSQVAPGGVITIEWTVGNTGTRPISGTWYDAVYLSPTPSLNLLEDRLLHVAPRGGGLAVGASYTEVWSGAIPDDVAGPYYLLVQTNAGGGGEIAETSLVNNVRAAPGVLAVAVPELEDAQSGHLDRGEWVFYRFDAPAGASLHLTLDSAVTTGAVDLYVRRGVPPTVSRHDAAAANSRPDEQLQFLAPAAGTYYVGVHGRSLGTGGTGFALTVATGELTIDRVTPAVAGNAGSVTVKIQGDRFDADAQVFLISPGGLVIDGQEFYQDSATLFATFDLAAAGAPAGSYDVRVANPGAPPVTASGALVVHAGGAATLTAELKLPSMARPGRETPITIQYTNTGNVDMASPLFTIESIEELGWIAPVSTCGDARYDPPYHLFLFPPEWACEHVALPLGGAGSSGTARPQPQRVTIGTISVLGLSSDGPATILRPGQTHTLTVEAITPFRTGDVPFELYAFGEPGNEDLNQPIDWGTFEQDVRSVGMPDNAWAPLFARLKAQVGTTWGHYLDALRDNAAHLAELGQRVHDAADLLAFEFLQAASMGLPSYLDAARDAFAPAPGLPLSFERYFLPSPQYRAREGALGSGWTHSFERWLEPRADDTIVVNGAGGMDRVFEATPTGGYVASRGEGATLQPQSDGGFLLVEPGGLQTRFRADGRFAYVRDTNGNQITAFYAGGRLSEVRHSTGDSFTFAYAANGRLQTLTDHTGRVTTFGYDAGGQHLAAVTRPDGQVTSYSYLTGEGLLRDHHLRSITYPTGPVAWFSYDALGRLQEHYLTPLGQPGERTEWVTYAYSTAGKTLITDALGNTATTWLDGRARVARTEDPLGNQVGLYYDIDSKLAAVLGPTGLVTSFQYDDQGNLTATRDSMGYQTSFGYGDYQNLAWVRDARGNMMSYGYDGSGNLTSITYEDGTAEHYTYDAAGNLTSYTNRRGATIMYTSDERGQFVGKDVPDTPGMVDFVYTYDASGRLTSATGPEGTTTYTYEPQTRRLVRIDYPAIGGKAIHLSFEYDAAGRRTKSTDQDGHVLNYLYHAIGRLEQMTDGADGLVADYQYDAAGRLVRKTLGNGVYTTYAYDAAWQLVSLVNHQPAGAVLSRFDYAYDALGRRVAMDTHYGLWTYQYDDTGQLTRAVLVSTAPDIADQDLTYVYDAVGNRIRTIINGEVTEYTTNNMNQYVQVGDRTYVFDADGNLIQETGPDGTTSYTYNHENRLVAVSRGEDAWQYTYDALGERVAVDENGMVTRYVVDPIGFGNVVGQYDAVGNVVARYDHGYGLLGQTDALMVSAYYSFDGLGSAAELTDSIGNIINYYSHDPFGLRLSRLEQVENPFQFLGEYGVMHEGNALEFMRARYHHTSIGRFITEDPLGLSGDAANLYAYAHNAPIDYTDVSGLTAGRRLRNAFRSIIRSLLQYKGTRLPTRAEYREFQESLRKMGLPSARNAEEIPDHFFFEWPPWLRDEEPRQPGASPSTYDPSNDGHIPRYDPSDDSVPLWNDPMDDSVYPFADPRDDSHYPGRDPNDRSDYPWNFPQPPMGTPIDPDSIPIWGSGTPEDKFGPAGYDAPDVEPGNEMRFISATPGELLSYRIDFWNDPDALVATQDALIVDGLDPDVFDLDTFQFTRFGFLRWDQYLPPGTQQIDTRVDLRPDMNLAVEVRAGWEMDVFGVNDSTGKLVWWFRAVDPVTGQYPDDPYAGFLPPFNEETEYELGWVEFTVGLKSGLPTGTRIENQALVQFDFIPNPKTGELWGLAPPDGPWVNTVDAGPPTSWVEPLAEVTNTLEFLVTWDGADDQDGSGIACYDVYFSTDDGPFIRWLHDVTDTSALFTGEPGRTYAFYAVAIDNVGHREPVPAAADTVTYLDIAPSASWQNPANALDADGNGVVEPLDALLINEINRAGSRELPPRTAEDQHLPYFDVSGDDFLTPLDVLMVINFINLNSGPQTMPGDSAEGEWATAWANDGQILPTAAISGKDRPEILWSPNVRDPVGRVPPVLAASVWRGFDRQERFDLERELPDWETLLDEQLPDLEDLDAYFAALG